MSSFYGGKNGRSFVIVKEYKSIREMAESFKKGPEYTEVNFDEYVLINTINKNNPENGSVFRRGYDFDSNRVHKAYTVERKENGEDFVITYENIPIHGGIYVGSIVGPAGKAPILHFGQYEDVYGKGAIAVLREEAGMVLDSEMAIKNYLSITYPNGNIAVVKPDFENGIRECEIDSSSDFTTSCVKVVLNSGLVYYYCYDHLINEDNPTESIGWYLLDTFPVVGSDKFNPEKGLLPGVEYKKDDEGNLVYEVDESGRRHLVPIKYQDSIDWTYCSMRNENNEDSTAYIGFTFAYPVTEFESSSVDAYYNRDNESHVFNNLNLIDRVDDASHPYYAKWQVNVPKGIKGESIKNIRVMEASDEVVSFVLDENGYIQYNASGIATEPYEGRDDDVANNRKIIVYDFIGYDRVPEGDKYVIYLGDFNVISSVVLNHNGQLDVDYTHDDTFSTPRENWIHWIDNVEFSDEGTVKITFNDSAWNQDGIENGVLTKEKLINWLTAFSLDKETGQLIVNFNNDNIEPVDQTLTWVKDIAIDEEGTITTSYTDKEDRVEKNKLKWIDNISLDEETGSFTVEFNYAEDENKVATKFEKSLTWVKDCYVNDKGEFITIYTNKEEEIGKDKIN
jgi:hypothetical protein